MHKHYKNGLLYLMFVRDRYAQSMVIPTYGIGHMGKESAYELLHLSPRQPRDAV